MKRCLTFLLAVLLCMTMALPVFAAVEMDQGIENKPAPEIKFVEGNFVAVVRDAEGNELLKVSAEDLIATGLGEIANSTEITDEAKEILQNAYNKFLNPDANLSIQASVMNEVAIDILGIHNTADSFGVWNLFDLNLKNQEALDLLKQEGNYLEVTFDLGENGAAVIASMVYSDKKWVNVELTNNGDGTVTCKFTLFGTVAFLYPFGAGGDGNEGSETDPEGDGTDPDGDDNFVPSIGYKPIPGLDPDEDGNVGGITDPNGNVSNLEPDCFSFISVAETEIPHGTLSDQERILRSVFNVMSNPNVKLSLVAPAMNVVAERLLGVGHDADDFVIRDLFYMDLVCEEHAGMFPAEGVEMKLAFDLGIDPDTIITGMIYIEGEWIPLDAVNNGDDTATFTFTDICPVAFLVPRDQQTNASAGVFLSSFFAGNADNAPAVLGATETGADTGIWMITGSVGLIAAVLLVGVYVRGKKRENA